MTDIQKALLGDKDAAQRLTLEQLREMEGQPVWVQTPGIPQYGRWVIVAGVSIEDKALYCHGDYTCRDYGKTWIAYAYPPAHIDREAWTAEWERQYKSGIHAGNGYVCSCCDMWNNRPSWFCPSCGKAMTPDAWATLEKRLMKQIQED